MTQPIDIYCERTGLGLWAEPLNAVTNLAFILAAVVVWWRFGRTGSRRSLGRLFSVLIAAVGIGSGTFHTWAVELTAIADVGAIAVFNVTYLIVFLRRVRVWSLSGAWIAGILYLLASILAGVFLGGTWSYMPALIVLSVLTWMMRFHSRPKRWLASSALLFAVSMLFRSMDESVCGIWPYGTHFLWHVLNALVLYGVTEGLMIAMETDEEIARNLRPS